MVAEAFEASIRQNRRNGNEDMWGKDQQHLEARSSEPPEQRGIDRHQSQLDPP
jgi:hypothetical protein